MPVGVMNTLIAEENILLVKSVFEKRNIPFWLMFGTCLGAIRNSAFIKYDRDTDLGVYKKDLEQIINIFTELKKSGFEVKRVVENDGVVSIMRKNTYIDFYIMEKCTQGWMWGSYLEGDYFSKLEDVVFLNKVFKTPSPVLEFIQSHYGQDWKIPITGRQASLVKI